MVMGIINLTPDSFYAQSRMEHEKQLLHACDEMLNDGASIIDIGGYSSRPGAPFVSEKEELDRVIPALSLLIKHFPEIILSVDTFRSTIARQSIAEGAAIINDISAGEDDIDMLSTIASLQVPYIMMHKRGTPQTMQQLTQYENVTLEIIDYFIQRIAIAKDLHIHDIIIDPGFGFAKNLEQNYTLLNQLDLFSILQKPLLIGLSRKKMIQQVIQSDAANALNGTSAANTIALIKGAKILRVHDVKAALECIKITSMLN